MNHEIWLVKTVAADAILNLGTNGVEWSTSHHCPFTPRELNPPTYCVVGWTDLQNWSECYAEEKNILPLLGFESKFLSCPACSIVVF
jgi:hypothetical protein